MLTEGSLPTSDLSPSLLVVLAVVAIVDQDDASLNNSTIPNLIMVLAV